MSHAPCNKIRYPLGFTGNTNATPKIPRALRTSNFKSKTRLYTLSNETKVEFNV